MSEILTKNPFALLDENADLEVPIGTSQIYDFISKELTREDDANVLRGSAATMCVRRRWFQGKGLRGKPLTPRKILNFMSGDITERVMASMVEKSCVGEGKMYSEVNFGEKIGVLTIQNKDFTIHAQIESSFKLGDKEVKCHFDGFGKKHDGTWELIEFKSAADYGFKSFQDKGPEDYLKQAHAYFMTDHCRSLDVKSVRFFYFRKSTGNIWDRSFHYSREMAKQVYSDYITSVGEITPPDPYGFVIKKETKTVGFPCTYCSFLEQCKGKHRIDWKRDQWGSVKPTYVFT